MAVPCLPTETVTDFGCIPHDPVGFATKLYGVGLSLLEIVVLIYLIYGGYILLSSRGDKTAIVKGRRIITLAIEALLLALAGFVIYQVIANDILKIPGFG